MCPAVLQVGQISFETVTGASGDDRGLVVGGETAPGLCATCRLLSCAPTDLQGVLETRQISARMETYTVNLNQSEAEAARDALGKALYDRCVMLCERQASTNLALTRAYATDFSHGWLVASTFQRLRHRPATSRPPSACLTYSVRKC